MRKVRPFILLLLATIAFTACKDKSFQKTTYTANVPVYMSYETFRSSVKSESAKSIEQFGKIYIYNNYLLINEPFEGIHVLDNSNPSAPVKLSFIRIPGNIDMAVRNNILYADSYSDLVALDINDITNVKELKRKEDAFSYRVPVPEQEEYPIALIDEESGVVVGYEVKIITEKDEDNYTYFDNGGCFNCEFAPMLNNNATGGGGGYKSIATSTGLAGSMAAFTISGDYLHAIDERDIKTFSLADFTLTNEENTQRTLETIFPHNDKLFFGTTTGMIVYDVSAPSKPSYFSDFNHAESCDPVVVQNNYAYVTLRTGNRCGGFSNQMDIINIENLADPVLEKTVNLTNPHGLGIDGNSLFVCDGAAGLRVFDSSNIDQIDQNEIMNYTGITAIDVIPFNNVLIMISEEGIFQYDYTNIQNISLISTVKM